jgi:hypothetical protein
MKAKSDKSGRAKASKPRKKKTPVEQKQFESNLSQSQSLSSETETVLFEPPKDGDLIKVTSKDTGKSWRGSLYYRTTINDSEKGEIEGACVLTEDFSEPGKLSVLFEHVEFWSRWEGESSAEYAERKKLIIAELQRQKAPIDPLDSFIGQNSIQGTWSTPKIGPAFKTVEAEPSFIRPNEGDLIEVHVRNDSETHNGVYFEKADRIYTRDRVVERAIIFGEGAGEIQYGDRFHYGVPRFPFAEWIRFRIINSGGALQSDWMPGPHYSNWAIEEQQRINRENEEAKVRVFAEWRGWLEKEIREAKGTADCIVFLSSNLKRELDNQLPDRELYVAMLKSRLEHFQEVLIVERGGGVRMEEANPNAEENGFWKAHGESALKAGPREFNDFMDKVLRLDRIKKGDPRNVQTYYFELIKQQLGDASSAAEKLVVLEEVLKSDSDWRTYPDLFTGSNFEDWLRTQHGHFSKVLDKERGVQQPASKKSGRSSRRIHTKFEFEPEFRAWVESLYSKSTLLMDINDEIQWPLWYSAFAKRDGTAFDSKKTTPEIEERIRTNHDQEVDFVRWIDKLYSDRTLIENADYSGNVKKNWAVIAKVFGHKDGTPFNPKQLRKSLHNIGSSKSKAA